jgi:phosphopantothenoylcysteine decarboxylase/phosphopantothenate--cysteine ligase
MSIDLARTPDILASVAKQDNGPFTVGFAAETENLREYALDKLEQKCLDMIIANQVGENRGFDSDDNTVDVYWSSGEQSFPTMSKARLAVDLIRLIAKHYAMQKTHKPKDWLSAVAGRD